MIDVTKHPRIHSHPILMTVWLRRLNEWSARREPPQAGRVGSRQTAPVLTKEMMATPTISLAMMSLMQMLAKDDSHDMNAPRSALMKHLEEVATKEWLAVLRETK